MQLRFLIVTGPRVEPAEISFGPGLNVIYGGSNTGKTHILRLVDYALGSKSPPEPIVEQAEYDLVHLGLSLDDGAEATLIRALQGGELRVLPGLVRDRPSPAAGTAMSATHGAKTSLSKFLLATLGALGARIRTNAAGTTRELSFRDLERFCLVNETKIQDEGSPVLSGQYVTKTAETSVFKYLLTGVDDSALDLAKPDPAQPLRQAAQLELIDKQVRDVDRQIAEADHDADELFRLDTALDNELAQTFELQETTEASYRQLVSRRRELRQSTDVLQDRVAEIDTLLARFALLLEHYDSDHKRLVAVIEAGSYFSLEEGATCPVCGAEPGHHRPDMACDGNVDEIVAAATAELADLNGRERELRITIDALSVERHRHEAQVQRLAEELAKLDPLIQRELPSVQIVRSRATGVLQRKVTLQRNLDLLRRRESLLAQRLELGVSPGYDSSTIVAAQQLDGAVLDSFSQEVEAELKLWDFPQGQRVFFELQRMDISVGGKSRSGNGKGVRALLHAAFSIGLMKYCRRGNAQRAHPGFVILDSLFVTYKDPSDDVEAQIAATPLKDRAFAAFQAIPPTLQLIILENVDVPTWLESSSQCIHFTGKAGVGRPGLFPALKG